MNVSGPRAVQDPALRRLVPLDRLSELVDRLRSDAPLLALPLVLVVCSFIGAALLPLVVQSRINASLDEIRSVIDPAEQALRDLQVGLALEAAGTRGYLLTGDPKYAAGHQEARARRKRALARLGALSPRLPAGVRRLLTDLEQAFPPADALLDALYGGTLTREQYMAILPAQHDRFVRITDAALRIQQGMVDYGAGQRDRIRSIQRAGTWIGAAAVLLALGAVLSIAHLARKHHELGSRERRARTALEALHEEAERRRQELERITESREALVRGFSHDLKNPLGAADGHLFMLERGVLGPLTEKQARAVEKSRGGVTSALRLIDELLALAGAAQGELDLRHATIDLRDVARQAVEQYRALADAKGLALRTEVPSTFPGLRSDAARIAQVLGNLIGNAIKYTKAGGIMVRVDTRIDNKGRTCAVVDVADTGTGIPKPAHELIFNEFRRVETGARAGGAGIGLAISQRVAQVLGGRVTVDSQPGLGSTFTLWLPFDPPDGSTAPEDSVSSSSN